MKKLAVLFVCVALLASCDGFKGGSKDLKAENDSLLMELNQRNAELDDMMGTFNEVQEGFRKINAAESRVDLQRGTITENSASAKQQIASDIEFISKQMEENKAQIAKLQAQLKNSNYNSAQMKKAVAALTAELNAKQQRIEELQTELASKNIRIQELDAAVSDLSAAKETLAAENEAKAKTVAEQEKSLNAAWFVFGTKSELKAQKILQSGDVLKSADFNKDYFTQIDIRTTKEIMTDPENGLKKLLKYQDDKKVLNRLLEIKADNKDRLIKYVQEHNGVTIDRNSIVDSQIKRLHAYKRQLLNVLRIIHLYKRMKADPSFRITPHTYIFAAKAAPSYSLAKNIIELINVMGDKINNDPEISKYMKVVFIENYGVSNAEIII